MRRRVAEIAVILLVLLFVFAACTGGRAAKAECEEKGGEYKYNVILKIWQCEGD